MSQDRSATAWAQELPSGARVSWAELEARAFRGRPRVLATLGGAGAVQRRHDLTRSPWFLVSMVFAVLPRLVLLLLPILAFAALAGNDFGLVFDDSSVAIAVAGGLMAISAAWQAVTIVRTLLGHGVEEAGGWIAAVVGLIAAVMIGVRGTADRIAGWEMWAGVALLAVVLGALVVVLDRRASRHAAAGASRPVHATEPIPDSATTSRRAAAIAAIPAAEREQIRAEVADAITILRRRGIVTPAQATRALDADLGSLAQRMTS